MTNSSYSSADDLPSVIELRQQLQGMRALSRVVARGKSAELDKLQSKVDALTIMIDLFYKKLGPRHWVFHDDLNVEDVRALLNDDADDIDALEAQFIDNQYSIERLEFMSGRLRSLPEMMPRMEMIRNSLQDYKAGRYYATTLVLITVMDGFVGDTEPGARKGLHAREADELAAWDSVVGHHQGLRSTQATFTKCFKRTTDDPTYELYRNGIIHGNLVNFDNKIVAAKAWNRLFAVADWAKAQRKQAEPAEPKPKWGQILRQMAETGKLQRRIEQWTSSTITADDPNFAGNALVAAATQLAEAWQRGQWARMGPFMPLRDQEREGKKLPRFIRDSFETPPLTFVALLEVRFVAPAIGECRMTTRFGDTGPFDSVSRWSYESSNGQPTVPPDESGSWRLVFGGSWPFRRDGQFQQSDPDVSDRDQE